MKKRIITFCIIMIILILLIIILTLNKNDNKNKIELAKEIYSKIDNLYTFYDGIQYVTNKENKINAIQKGEKIYYQIEDYTKVTSKIMTKKMETQFINEVNIINIEDKYYIENVGHGSNGLIGLNFKLKSKSSKKISLVVQSKFCEINYKVEQENGCKSEEYEYIVEKPFILVKEDGIWKVDEYTSIFQFSDRELK